MTANPAFLMCKAEAAIIGRLLSGYGELEYLFALCLAYAVGNQDRALRTFFGIRGEAIRLDVADSLMRDMYAGFGIADKYDATVSDLRACRRVRNTFAHCHWASDPKAGLFYVDLEKSAERKAGPFRQEWLHIDVALLEEIEAYFMVTKKRLLWLEEECAIKSQRGDRNYTSWPEGRQQPKLHNPESQHIPPWLPKAGETG